MDAAAAPGINSRAAWTIAASVVSRSFLRQGPRQLAQLPGQSRDVLGAAGLSGRVDRACRWIVHLPGLFIWGPVSILLRGPGVILFQTCISRGDLTGLSGPHLGLALLLELFGLGRQFLISGLGVTCHLNSCHSGLLGTWPSSAGTETKMHFHTPSSTGPGEGRRRLVLLVPHP